MQWLSDNDTQAAGVRLFCLPHAGAGAAAYYRWKRLLPPTIAVCPVHLPGRERRMGEVAFTHAQSLVAELLFASAPLLQQPYAVFGHSMGSLLAYEFVRQIAAAGLPAPRRLFASGRDAPHAEPSHRGLHLLGDEAFLDALRHRFGGVPEEVLADPELRAMFLRVLRADLTVVETYQCQSEPTLQCPIAVFAGTGDQSVTEAGLEAWRELTSAGASVERFPGAHFYHLGSGQTALLDVVERCLRGPESRED